MSKAYFARDALSNSGIKEILKSPLHFHTWTNNPKEDNSAFRIGRALHRKILEPHMEKLAIFSETKTFNSKAGDAFLERYRDTDYICLTVEEHMQVEAMAAAVGRVPKIMRLLDTCDKEVEIYGQEPTSCGPIDTKAMLDAVNGSLILDLKTTADAAIDFPYAARRYQYDIQAAWYADRAFARDGIMRDFYFIVVEKNPPYGVLMYQAGDKFMADGRLKIMQATEVYGRCKALNLWPGYDTDTILTL